MARVLFGDSAIGSIISQIQQALTNAGFSTQGVDGWYGNDTHRAMAAYQNAQNATATGLLDDANWPSLMASPIPSTSYG